MITLHNIIYFYIPDLLTNGWVIDRFMSGRLERDVYHLHLTGHGQAQRHQNKIEHEEQYRQKDGVQHLNDVKRIVVRVVRLVGYD